MSVSVQIPQANVYADERQILSIEGLGLKAGERVAVVGRSGSGKSTFLKLIAGLVPFTGQPMGFLKDEDGSPAVKFISRVESRKLFTSGIQVAYVPQQLGLWAHMTILENISLPARRLRGLGKIEATERCREVLSQLGLSSKIDDRPSQLSGGEQQRVAVARASICTPQLILLDEITSALDPSTTGEILELFPKLFSEDATVVFVTHQYGFARQFATSVLYFDSREYVTRAKTNEIDGGFADSRLLRLVSDSKQFYSW